ncbi:hypothetical protein ABZ901_10865 [Actinacidiphila alni]|uniref:hypothetical protein n=1 Tax=Actinacidiphila alni TaxID=380248 RepID=UPI0033D3BAAD
MEQQTSASLTLDYRDGQGRPVRAESSVATNGDCVGTLTAGGGRAQVIHIGPAHYLKGDPAFWTWATRRPDAPTVPRLWVGRWVQGWLAQLEAYGADTMCSLTDAVADLTADFGGKKRETGPRNHLGHPTVSVTQSNQTGSITLDITTTGPAVVLRGVQKSAGSTTVTTTFTHLNVPVHAKAPAGAVDSV